MVRLTKGWRATSRQKRKQGGRGWQTDTCKAYEWGHNQQHSSQNGKNAKIFFYLLSSSSDTHRILRLRISLDKHFSILSKPTKGFINKIHIICQPPYTRGRSTKGDRKREREKNGKGTKGPLMSSFAMHNEQTARPLKFSAATMERPSFWSGRSASLLSRE